MGANLRYDITLATDADLKKTYQTLLQRISDAGLPEGKYRQAWQDYIRDKQQGIFCPPSSSAMSAGLMLGLWLERENIRAHKA